MIQCLFFCRAMMFAKTATCCDSHPLGSSSTDGTGIWSMMGVWGFHGDFMGIYNQLYPIVGI